MMSNIIHMETDLTRDLARQVQRTVNDLDYRAAHLKSAMARLTWAWQGPSAARYQAQMHTWLRRFENDMQYLQHLSVRLTREVDEWEQVDSSGASAFKAMKSAALGAVAGGVIGGTGGVVSPGGGTEGDSPGAGGEDPQPSPVTQPQPSPTHPTGNVQRINDTISGMDVEHNAKYQARDGKTYCNIFTMDYAEKMGVPLPEYLDFDGDGRIDDYLNANESVTWLRGTYDKGGVATGPQQGWAPVDSNNAAELSKQGYVVVAGWENKGGIGHMAVVRPNSEPGNIRIAQAGGSNFSDGSLSQGFGTGRNVEFFAYRPDAS